MSLLSDQSCNAGFQTTLTQASDSQWKLCIVSQALLVSQTYCQYLIYFDLLSQRLHSDCNRKVYFLHISGIILWMVMLQLLFFHHSSDMVMVIYQCCSFFVTSLPSNSNIYPRCPSVHKHVAQHAACNLSGDMLDHVLIWLHDWWWITAFNQLLD